MNLRLLLIFFWGSSLQACSSTPTISESKDTSSPLDSSRFENLSNPSLARLVAQRPVKDRKGSRLYLALFASHPDVSSINIFGKLPEDIALAFWDLRERAIEEVAEAKTAWQYRFTRSMIDYLEGVGLEEDVIKGVQGFHYLRMRNKSAAEAKTRINTCVKEKTQKEEKRNEYLHRYRAKKRKEKLEREGHRTVNIDLIKEFEASLADRIEKAPHLMTAVEIEERFREIDNLYDSRRQSSRAVRTFMEKMGYDIDAIKVASGARTKYLREKSLKKTKRMHYELCEKIIAFEDGRLESNVPFEDGVTESAIKEPDSIETSNGGINGDPETLDDSTWWEKIYKN